MTIFFSFITREYPFYYKGVAFTIKVDKVYDDYTMSINNIIINDEVVMTTYNYDFIKKLKRVKIKNNRSENEVIQILNAAFKEYDNNLKTEAEKNFASNSYFK